MFIQIIRISVEQQSKEISSVKKNYEEIRLLRHDMRLLLNNVALCIENDEKEKALEMISTYSTHIEGTKLERFCSNDTVNYVLSDFSAKCSTNHIHFKHEISFGELGIDDISFFSILSNILDNALNAQLELPEADRYVKLLLKSSDGKILLSVKNTLMHPPQFADGLPVASKKGH